MAKFWENDESVSAPKASGKSFWENDPVAERPAPSGFDAAEYAAFKAGKGAGSNAGGGFDPSEYAAFKAQAGRAKSGKPNPFDQFDAAPAQKAVASGASEADRAVEALAPFFSKGVSTRNSAGQWTGEARALLTKAGLNPDTIDQKAERGLLSTYESQQSNDQQGSAAVGRGIIEGVPVIGPAMLGGTNKAIAFVRSVQNGTSYNDELKNVEAFGNRIAKENPKAATGGEMLGGVVGTAPLVAAAPAAFGAGVGGLAVRSGLSAASSGALGAADAAVRSDGDRDQIAGSAALGGGLGLIAPGAGALVGKGVNAAIGAVATRNARVPGAGPATAARLAEDLRNSGGGDAVRARLQELGPEAMLLDASPSLEGRAQGLATRPETRETITSPLAQRAAGANTRLGADVDTHLGRTTDPAAFHAALDEAYDGVVPGLYRDALAAGGPVDTSNVLASIDRLGEAEKGGAQQALRRAWDLLHTEGDVPEVGRALIPDRRAAALHNVKEELDAQIASVRERQGSAARSELNALTTVRQELNAALEAQVPGYAEANRTARHFFQQRDAFNRGQTLLNGGREAIRPAQLADETLAMTPEVAAAQQAGLRAEVDRLTGTRLNDRAALRGALLGEGDYNRARLGTVFGEEPTAGLASAVDREVAFDAANQRIVGGSQTAQRTAAANDMGVRDLSPSSSDQSINLAGLVGGRTGAASALALKGLRLGANAAGRASDIARNREAASILTMRAGPERDALISALEDRLAAASRGEVPASQMDRFVRQVLQSQNDRSERNLPSPALGQ